MPQKCSICVHEKREAIDHDLAMAMAGQGSLAEVSRAYRVSRHSLGRHRGHLETNLAAAMERRVELRAETIMANVKDLHAILDTALRKAALTGEIDELTKCSREVRGTFELYARLSGQISNEVNIIMSTDWRELQAVIFHALLPFPEARVALVEALDEHVRRRNGQRLEGVSDAGGAGPSRRLGPRSGPGPASPLGGSEDPC